MLSTCFFTCEVCVGGDERPESTLTSASTPPLKELPAASVGGGGLDDEELILPRLRTGCSWSAGSKILRLFCKDIFGQLTTGKEAIVVVIAQRRQSGLIRKFLLPKYTVSRPLIPISLVIPFLGDATCQGCMVL